MNRPTAYCYEFGPFRLDAVKRLLLRDGAIVPLQSKDFDLLLALVEHSGQVLDKDDLMRQVWPDSVVEEGNLSVHIFALRRALGETPDDHRYIVTAPGRGYSFVADVGAVSGANAGALAPRWRRKPAPCQRPNSWSRSAARYRSIRAFTSSAKPTKSSNRLSNGATASCW